MFAKGDIDIVSTNQPMVGGCDINLHHLAHHLELLQVNIEWFDDYRGDRDVGFEYTLNANRVSILNFSWSNRPCVLDSLPGKKSLGVRDLSGL